MGPVDNVIRVTGEVQTGDAEMKKRKIVIHPGYGGFGLTNEQVIKIMSLGYEGLKAHRTGSSNYLWYSGATKIPRDNPLLIQIVEETPKEERCLEIVEIPYDVEWEINDYDGAEWVAETHRKWRFEEVEE